MYVSHDGDMNGISVINASDYSVDFIGSAGKRLSELTICQIPLSFIIKPIQVTLIPHLTSPTPTPAPSSVPPGATSTAVPTSVPTQESGPTSTETPSPGPSISPETNVTQNPSASASPAPSATPGFGAIIALVCLSGAAFLARKR